MGMAANTETTNLLKGRFGSTAPAAKPATWYLGLSTTIPVKNEDTGVIENLTEVSAGGYARISLPNNDTTWTVQDGQATLAITVSWKPTATLSGEQPGYWFIANAATAGVVEYAGYLPGQVDWVSGSEIQVSGLTVSLLDV